MKAVYVQKRVNGLEKIILYLTAEKITFETVNDSVQIPVYSFDDGITKSLSQYRTFEWISRLKVTGELGSWNLRIIFDHTWDNDLTMEYKENRLQIFT